MRTKSIRVRETGLIIAGTLIALFLFSTSTLMAEPENVQRLAPLNNVSADGVPLDNVQSREAELKASHLSRDLNSSSHMVKALDTAVVKKNFRMAQTASYGVADVDGDGVVSNAILEYKLADLMIKAKDEKAAEDRMLTVRMNNQEKSLPVYNKSPELITVEKEAVKNNGLPSGQNDAPPAVTTIAYGRNLSEKTKNEEKADKINDGMILPELTKGQPLENQMAASQVEMRFKMPAERFAVLEGKPLPKNQLENFVTQKGNASLSEDNIKAMDRLKDKKIEDQKSKLASQWNLVTNPKDSNSGAGNSEDAKKKMWLVDQPVIIHGAQKYEEPQGAKTARDYIQNHLGGNRPYGMSPAMKAQQAKKLEETPPSEKSELSQAQKEKLIGEFKSYLLSSKAYAKSQLTEIDNKKK